MKKISASYNFPSGFMWGIDPCRDMLADADINSFLFTLSEKHADALSVSVSWAKCEPLKAQFDERYIDSLRSLFIKIKNRNLEPVVIMNGTDTPPWLNLDVQGKSRPPDTTPLAFYKYLSDCLIPYAKFFCIHCSPASVFKNKTSEQMSAVYQETSGYLHSLSDKAKVGMILPESFSTAKPGGLNNYLFKRSYSFLKAEGIDFLGIRLMENSLKNIQDIFGKEERIPLMVISDRLSNVPDAEKTECLADNLFDIWHLYQKGWTLLGYITETELTGTDPAADLYEISCQNNALYISTDQPFLPEKWQRFLID